MTSQEGSILIVGAARGMGRAFAQLCVERGERHLILADREYEELRIVAEELCREGANIEAHALDLADSGAIEAFAAEIEGVDRVALVAGMLQAKPALEVDNTLFTRLMQVNFLGNYQLAQALCRKFIGRGIAGSIVAVTSNAARRPQPGLAAYCASKAALTMALKVLAKEVIGSGIRINFVAPGATRTGMILSDPEQLARAMPMGRINEPIDIARAIWFLLSADSAMMTMRELSSDCGALDGL